MAGSTFGPKARAEIMGRSYGLCQRDACGPATDAHHRRVKGMGGSVAPDTNTVANGIALASRCHALVHHHVDDALLLGLLLPQGSVPADEPAWLLLPYGLRWYKLGPDLEFHHDRPDPPSWPHLFV